jgi:hypothetical protein
MSEEVSTPTPPVKRKRVKKQMDPAVRAQLDAYVKAHPASVLLWNVDWHRDCPEALKRHLYARRYRAKQAAVAREQAAERRNVESDEEGLE